MNHKTTNAIVVAVILHSFSAIIAGGEGVNINVTVN